MGLGNKTDLKQKRNNSFAIGVLVGILIVTAFLLIIDDDPTAEEVDACALCIDQGPEEE